MKIHTFLEQVHQKNLHNQVYCFSIKNPPLLFLSKIRQLIADKYTVQSVDLATISEQDLQAQLAMSFLGQEYFYWLHGFHELDAKLKKVMLAFIASYDGPHKLIMLIDGKAPKPLEDIELPEKVNAADFRTMYTALMQQAMPPLFVRIFKKLQTSSLDSLMVLAEYGVLLGADTKLFTDEWLDRIVAPDYSLFMLSTYFFGKKKKSFFALWMGVKDLYPEAFWTSYWSEQLFRAYGYSKYAKRQDFTKAKKIGYRLPFSFIQKDWRSVEQAALIKAHQSIYYADWHAKNSLHPYLELTFLEFMA